MYKLRSFFESIKVSHCIRRMRRSLYRMRGRAKGSSCFTGPRFDGYRYYPKPCPKIAMDGSGASRTRYTVMPSFHKPQS